MALQGSERKILHAILREQQADAAGYVEDSHMAAATKMSVQDVRDWLETLEGKGFVERSRGTEGFSAYVTAKGKLELRGTPVIDESGGGPAERPPQVVPKGLRSYDEHDADFFLELLPGPRRADGLPESVHFWKVRIEEMDPDKTFRVGVVFGPSGCGKSSLVKAGLLPRLSKSVIPIYIEATAQETEARLLRGLRKHNPDLPSDLDLQNSLIAVKERIGDGARKILLVIDQFEQWLHAKRREEDTELVRALRHCEGNRTQAIVMVRDDFSMALLRFMGEQGVELHQGQNFAVVDLFDIRHSKKVLTSFGQAFGTLPSDLDDITKEQREFIDQAVSGLAQDGKIVSVRLALFAEMVKGKPWTPATLREVGGTEGVGVTFLEETFGSAQANPKHRQHQKAAQAVLKALLPQSGTDIKGRMRSEADLRDASGYAIRPRDFNELTRILDAELRLITPTDPEGSIGEGEGQPTRPSGERYYQLTHDYLVPSLREWLTRKLSETRRGRAELRLAERSALWNAKPENRHLPSAWEWANIRVLTHRKDWADPQRRMMRRAARIHGLRGLGLAVLIVLGTWGGIESYGNLRASALVESLKTASTEDVPAIIKQLKDYRRWAGRPLSRLLSGTDKENSPHLRASLASLALLPDDGKQAAYLYDRLLAASPVELPVICGILEKHTKGTDKQLWRLLEDPKADPEKRFRAACALAITNSARDKESWSTVSPFITDRFLTAVNKNPGDYSPLIETLRPVRRRLLTPLASIFRDTGRSESERRFATTILADYASDDPNQLADLLMDSGESQFADLFKRLRNHPDQAVSLMNAELAKPSPSGTEETKDDLAKRQARAAVALVRLGHADAVWPKLEHCPDPRLRSYILNWLKPLGADPGMIAAELDRIKPVAKPTPTEGQQPMEAILFNSENSKRRALILALGQYDTEHLSPEERDSLIDNLLAMYENDPDAGIHGASEWTLRQWKQEGGLKQKDDALRGKDRGDRRWYVNGQGHTFAVIEGPVEFLMGSPEDEPEHFDNELLHKRVIPRRFAIATKEVTVERYQEFLKQNPKIARLRIDWYSPESTGPMIGMTWYEAAAYCNWLSEKDRIPQDQWCYEPKEGEYAEGMTIPEKVLERKGYRLPTEAEWEYACRAGAETSRYFGFSKILLDKYARYQANSQDHAWPGGSLLPNDLGLFDMLGNVYEGCQERFVDYQPDEKGFLDDIIKES